MKPASGTLLLALLVHGGALPARAAPPANAWTRLERGDIPGQRWDVALGYAPRLKRFLVLGGRTSWGEYRQGPRLYDQLALDGEQGRWENWFPGQELGAALRPLPGPRLEGRALRP